jgi:hypothetical protein
MATGRRQPSALFALDGWRCFRRLDQQVLASELAADHVVTLDKLPAHKVRGVRYRTSRRDADPSSATRPLKMAFSKFNALLRAAAARAIPDLWEAICIALDEFQANQTPKLFRRR